MGALRYKGGTNVILKLLRFNPYSNREVVGSPNISYYNDYVVKTIEGVNFIPGDNVNTSVILNITEAESTIDYLLAIDETGSEIISRWFVMECSRTRAGQYKAELFRDVKYDYKTEIGSASAYIRRGWISDNTNPLLFNQEEFTTNQIVVKSGTAWKEELRSGSGPWIVGYLSKTAPGTTIKAPNGLVEIDRVLTENEFEAFGGDEGDLDQQLNGLMMYGAGAASFYSSCNVQLISGDDTVQRSRFLGSFADYINNVSGHFYAGSDFGAGSWGYKSPFFTNADLLGEYIVENLGATTKTNIQAQVRSEGEKQGYLPFASWNRYDGKNVAYKNQIYKVQIVDIPQTALIRFKCRLPAINNAVANLMNASNTVDGTVTGESANVYITAGVHLKSVRFTPNGDFTYKVDIPAPYNRSAPGKAPYDIFAVLANWGSDTAASYRIAQAISEHYKGSGALYDLQLVPYIDATGAKEVSITGTDSKMYWLNNSLNQEGTKTIAWSGSPWVGKSATVTNIKTMNQCTKARVIAPNHSAMHDFSPAAAGKPASGGGSFTVKFTLKPYAPMFAIGLPVGNANAILTSTEDIGNWLVISGDFSLPQTTDAWQTYQINNKNYLNAFNRQIETVELNNKYAKLHDVAGAISGAVSASVSAGTTGAAVGGAPGAIVGAAVGGLVSGIAGAADVAINEKLRTDQLDLQKDMFAFNLQNVQALPNTLAAVGAYDAMNYLYPYVVIYDATAKEKAAFENYLKYKGMTIGVIDTVNNYKASGHFIQADIIKIDLHDDQHMINTIREEVAKGFYDGRVN